MDTTREDRIEEMRVAQQVAGCIVVIAIGLGLVTGQSCSCMTVTLKKDFNRKTGTGNYICKSTIYRHSYRRVPASSNPKVKTIERTIHLYHSII